MTKFDVINWRSGQVQFSAEIDCPPDAPRSEKMGLAVRWAVENNAKLSEADLTDANLSEATLAEVDLSGTKLSEANLTGADLTDANLTGAKWDSITISRPPLQFYGLEWPIHILEGYMQIGCEIHSLPEWEAFDDRRIAAMDGREALKFWRAHKDWLLTAARADGRWEPVLDVAA